VSPGRIPAMRKYAAWSALVGSPIPVTGERSTDSRRGGGQLPGTGDAATINDLDEVPFLREAGIAP
jgi:hypothetical protein